MAPVCSLISGSPENRTQHNAVIGRVWTTSPRLPRSSRAPRSRTQALPGFAVPTPVHRTGISCAHSDRKWAHMALATNPASVPIGARVSGSSDQRYSVSATSPSTKKPGAVCSTGFLRSPRNLARCHNRKQRTSSVFAGPPAKHASMRCSVWRLDHKNIIVLIPSVQRPSPGHVICVKLLSEG